MWLHRRKQGRWVCQVSESNVIGGRPAYCNVAYSNFAWR